MTANHQPQSIVPGATVADATGELARIVDVEQTGQQAYLLLQTQDARKIRIAQELVIADDEENCNAPLVFADIPEGVKITANQTIIPIVEEQLKVGKRTVDSGRGVRIHKTVAEREENIATPTVRDEIEIKTVGIGRLLGDEPPPQPRREGNTYIIPILEEILVVQKQLRLKEEVHIVRRARTEQKLQTVRLRAEQVAVERFEENAESSPEPALSNKPANPNLAVNSAADSGIDSPVRQEVLKEAVMANTLVGVYDNPSAAQDAYNELIASGFDASDLQLSNSRSDQISSGRSTADTGLESEDRGFGSGIRRFFHSLFGGDDTSRNDVDIYSEAVRRGHYVLTVNTDSEERSGQAMQVMNRYDPVDIDERATQWRSSGWTGYDETAPALSDAEIEQERGQYAGGAARGRSEGTTIPVVEEELQVGKREIQRGGVRVYQRITERPVEESVRLREERVNVERRPVNEAASEADLAAMREGSLEIRETAEEPVVSKTARVVEEVAINKEATEHTETVRDKVRRSDVEVEQLGAARDARLDDSDEYRRHFQSTYGTSGGRYEDYDQAYRYGSTLAGDDRYRGYRWDQAEPNLRQDWESSHRGNPWERVKDAVRYGWEKVTR